MRKPHPLDGVYAGQPVYGIKSLAVLAPRLAVALDDCDTASQSRDARDKYFAVSVADYNIAPFAALRSELPALAAAKASLSTALREVGCASEIAWLCQHGSPEKWQSGSSQCV